MNDDIPFWTWVNDTTLGIVTDREVYHWKVMEGQTAPTKVCVTLSIHSSEGGLTFRCSTDIRTYLETRSSTTRSRRMANGSSWSVSRPIPTHRDSRSRELYSSTRSRGVYLSLSRVTPPHSQRSRWMDHPSPQSCSPLQSGQPPVLP